MGFLSTLDVEVVLWKTENTLTNELLSETLVDWRKNYIYEIDGVIVTNDANILEKLEILSTHLRLKWFYLIKLLKPRLSTFFGVQVRTDI
jgi:hypothetical protein